MGSPTKAQLTVVLIALLVGSAGFPLAAPAEEPAREPLLMVVMDPLAAPLSCVCVDGVGQRKYQKLAEHLRQRLGRKVEVVFEEALDLAVQRAGRQADLIVGKHSVVLFDAERAKTPVRRLMLLTDRRGRTHHTGLFLVRSDDAARSLRDLKERRIALGPPESEETHAAAKRALAKSGVADGKRIETAGSIDAAVYRVADGEAAAAIVPDYLPPLLEGCGKVRKGALRSVGATEPVPFVAVFATQRLSPREETAVRGALSEVAQDKELLEALESKRGFVAFEDDASSPKEKKTALWTDWRGPGRRGWSDAVPRRLPAEPRVVWRAKVTGPALAGIAAADKYVVVPDKDEQKTTDIFRCFDARTGRPVWQLKYAAAGDVQYTNAPRATPVIHRGRVYLQGALGDLHCVDLKTGRVVWRRNLLDDFGAEPLVWGCSIPPLVFDDKLLVTPGAKQASVAALALDTGETVWKTPGHAAAYSPYLLAALGGRRQLVGYDVAGLAGWDPKTGRRLWEMIPPGQADFNVVTPLVLNGGVLLATENNATRWYRFNDHGEIVQKPAMTNNDLAPDTSSPVVVGDRLYCTAYGEMFCLDLRNDLTTLWIEQDDMFYDHTNLIAGKDRVLAWTTTGDLLLIRADVDRYEVVSHLRPFAGEDVETMSHPALVGDRLYLRSQNELVCLDLAQPPNTQPKDANHDAPR